MVATTAAGCAYLVEQPSLATRDYIEVMERAAIADKAGLARLQAEADARYRASGSAADAMSLALVLSAPTAGTDDLRRSAELLSDLAGIPEPQKNTLRKLASARLAEVKTRLSLHSADSRKSGRITELQRQLDEANAKIDELLDIERSMENGRRRNGNEDLSQ